MNTEYSLLNVIIRINGPNEIIIVNKNITNDTKISTDNNMNSNKFLYVFLRIKLK